jgi:hypothetical protein
MRKVALIKKAQELAGQGKARSTAPEGEGGGVQTGQQLVVCGLGSRNISFVSKKLLESIKLPKFCKVDIVALCCSKQIKTT